MKLKNEISRVITVDGLTFASLANLETSQAHLLVFFYIQPLIGPLNYQVIPIVVVSFVVNLLSVVIDMQAANSIKKLNGSFCVIYIS